MRKVIKALPSIKFIAITVAVSLVIGFAIAEGFNRWILIGPAMGAIFLAMVTARNYDPMQWESIHDPLAHSMRLQRDVVVSQLRAVVDTYDRGDMVALEEEMTEARTLVSEIRPPTTQQ